MEVKVQLRRITITDEQTGEKFTVMTIRSAEDIADYVEESERDEVRMKLEGAVTEVYDKLHNEKQQR